MSAAPIDPPAGDAATERRGIHDAPGPASRRAIGAATGTPAEPWVAGTPRPRRRSRGLLLGRIGGIPIIVSPSWLISAAIIVALATPVVAQVVHGIPTAGAVGVAALLAVLLGVSVLAHELGHCLAARSLGLGVREVRLYLVGGVSELDRSPSTPKEEALIAAAGPGVSALLAIMCGLLVGSTSERSIGWLLLLEMALANGIVAVFNVLPALPLDGGRVLRAAVWRVFRRRRSGTVAGVAGGFAVATALLVWGGVAALSGTRIGLLQAGIVAVMGVFVAVGAVGEWPFRRERTWPPGVTLQSLARPLLQLPGETPVAMALRAADGRAAVLTGVDGAAVGVLDYASAIRLGSEYPFSPASLAAWRVVPGMVISVDDAPDAVLERLAQVSSSYFLLVDAEGRPRGMVARADLDRALTGTVTEPLRP